MSERSTAGRVTQQDKIEAVLSLLVLRHDEQRICRKFKVRKAQLLEWRDEFLRAGVVAFEQPERHKTLARLRGRIEELKTQLEVHRGADKKRSELDPSTSPVVIATRTLILSDPRSRRRRRLTVQVLRPRRTHREWVCAVRVQGLDRGADTDSFRHVYGEDSLQALMLAFDCLYALLRPHEQNIDWGDLEGETGISRTMPLLFGAEFKRRIDRLIERENLRLARQMRAKEGGATAEARRSRR